ncbi:MAG: type II secretion system F family protein [Acidobacteriota bacterium]
MDLQIVLLLGAVFVSLAVATGVLVWSVTDPQVAQRRLSRMAPGAGATLDQPISLIGEAMTPMARRVRAFVPKSPKDMGRIERMLAGAGYYGAWPATMYVLAQISLPIGVGLFVISYFGTSTSTLVFAGLAAALGYYTPDLWLGRAIERRKREISNGLPDAIDLLIVCIESGSGIDQALARVADELSLAYPALAREMEMIATETRAGKPRLEAFRNFAARTKVEDVRSLVNMLVQTDKFGTSIGQALRTHAETSRTKRRQRAEEKAAKLGVKLLFPLVFCLFPAFYLVVLGPSMVRIFREFVWGFGAR